MVHATFYKVASSLVIACVFCLNLSVAYSQDVSLGDSATSASAADQKAQAKAQRKGERKAAREKNKAEVKQLQSNGYGPGGTIGDYPLNLQKAEIKGVARSSGASNAGAAKPSYAPASGSQY